MKLGCSVQVNNVEELTQAISDLLLNDTKRNEMIHIGKNFVKSQSKVINSVTSEINKILLANHANT